MSRRWSALLLLVISGCGSQGSDGDASALPTAPPEASPAATPKPAADQATAPGPLASCSDDLGDSTGVLDLTGIEVQRAADGSLLFVYKFRGDIPQRGDVLFSTVAAKKQYAYGIRDGQKKAHAVIDFNTLAQPMGVTGVVDISPGEARFGFPEGDVDRGTGGINIDGDSVDLCSLG